MRVRRVTIDAERAAPRACSRPSRLEPARSHDRGQPGAGLAPVLCLAQRDPGPAASQTCGLQAALGLTGTSPEQLGRPSRPGSSAARSVQEDSPHRILEVSGVPPPCLPARAGPKTRTRAHGSRAASPAPAPSRSGPQPLAQAQLGGGRSLPTAGGAVERGSRGRPGPRRRRNRVRACGAGRLCPHRSARLRASAECPQPL